MRTCRDQSLAQSLSCSLTHISIQEKQPLWNFLLWHRSGNIYVLLFECMWKACGIETHTLVYAKERASSPLLSYLEIRTPFLPCPVIYCPTTGINATGSNDHKLKLCKQRGQMKLSWSEIGSDMLGWQPKIEHWLQPVLNRWIHYRTFVFRSLRLKVLPLMGVVRMNF